MPRQRAREGTGMLGTGKLRVWGASVDLNTRIIVLVGLLALLTVALTTGLVRWTTRRIVEDAIGDQMAVQARITAHLVEIAEQRAGMTPAEIDRHLAEIAAFAMKQRGYEYEFWVTDPAAKVYLGTIPINFTFTPEQAQAGEFLHLLEGDPKHTDLIVQDSRKREI